jgi:hypothetical protein
MKIDFLKAKIPPDEKKRNLTIKITPHELSLCRVKAMQFCDGNISEWVRYAAVHLLPPAQHIDFDASADPEEMLLYGKTKEEDAWRLDAIRKELHAFSKKFNKMDSYQIMLLEKGDPA